MMYDCMIASQLRAVVTVSVSFFRLLIQRKVIFTLQQHCTPWRRIYEALGTRAHSCCVVCVSLYVCLSCCVSFRVNEQHDIQ